MSKKIKLYTVVRVDSEIRRVKQGGRWRNCEHVTSCVCETFKSKAEAEREFKFDLGYFEFYYKGKGKSTWKNVRERRLWDREFKFGHRWYIVEAGPIRLSPWDEDYAHPNDPHPGLLKINPR